jgi:hypothetical protein
MGILQTIDLINKAQEIGKQIANPQTWADRANLTKALVVAINTAAIAYMAITGDHTAIPPGDVQIAASALSMLGVWIVNRIHVAANKDIGK